jgi:hypothetical protein
MPTRFAFRLMRPTVNWIQKAVGMEMRLKLCDLIDVPVCCWGEDQSCGHFFLRLFFREAAYGKIIPFSHRQLAWDLLHSIHGRHQIH